MYFLSDVERICKANHDRRKWAEEVEFAGVSGDRDGKRLPRRRFAPPRNDSGERRQALRAACTACMMACGGGAAFVGIGLAMGHWMTVIVGTVVAAVFLLTGTKLEDITEGREDDA